MEVNGTCSWSFLGHLLHASLMILLKYWKPMGNAPGVSWANSLNRPYEILIRSRYNMFLELIGPNPLHSFTYPLFNQWRMVLEFPTAVPSQFFIKSLLRVHDKCSWNFLVQFLRAFCINAYQDSMQIVPGANSAAFSFTFI